MTAERKTSERRGEQVRLGCGEGREKCKKSEVREQVAKRTGEQKAVSDSGRTGEQMTTDDKRVRKEGRGDRMEE